MELVLDVENKTTLRRKESSEDYYMDLSPYCPTNFLVTVGCLEVGTTEAEVYILNHPEFKGDAKAEFNKVQDKLDKATLLIMHNAIHDLEWLLESGFKYDGPVWDTMIAEFVFNRGIRGPLSLEDLAIDKNLPHKKSDLVGNYFKEGKTVDQVPLQTLAMYNAGDLESTAALYTNQKERLGCQNSKGLLPTIRMMCDYTRTLVRMRQAGIYVDKDELRKIREEFIDEQRELETFLVNKTKELMGDVEINLNSSDFKSKIFYSRELTDKRQWCEQFNIGLDERGKKKKRPRMRNDEFIKYVRKYTQVVRKKRAEQCDDCGGTGYYTKIKKDGSPFKKATKCLHCTNGIKYIDRKEVAGWMLIPDKVSDVAQGGFETNKHKLEEIINSTNNTELIEYCKALIRREALDTYINTFVNGLLTYTQDDGFLHPNFLQCVAATGRLSCVNPNLLNQPRGTTFPIKRAFKSRFEGGEIAEVDFKQLEFRIAGYLSQCEQVLQDIKDDIDAHANTRDIVNNFDKNILPISRQDAKPHTFKPLYGGMSGLDRFVNYYKWFLERYKGINRWHDELLETALTHKRITLPSGRQYDFPYTKRNFYGYVNGTTQIVNYPVQGFATADLVPLGIMAVELAMWEYELKHNMKFRSVLILTVHDSLEIDLHPEEKEIMLNLVAKAMVDLNTMCMKYYNLDFQYPIEVEIKCGPTWYGVRDYHASTN
jgi:DNA polymerase I-like protein with 3'-5' exonuclease and polymerase domains